MINMVNDFFRVVSLILCHDKPRSRARQIERLMDIAHELRALNNYSALRAFVAGINNSTFQGDKTMEIFKTRLRITTRISCLGMFFFDNVGLIMLIVWHSKTPKALVYQRCKCGDFHDK
jgi:hypothetical protein